MATTSFLYHTLGLHGYRLLSTEYVGGEVVYRVEMAPGKRRCRGCRAPWHELKLAGKFERRFLALPVGRRTQVVVLEGHRQECRRCGAVLREPIPFADGESRHLRAFARFAVALCGIATVKHVAKLLRVGWDLVKDVFKGHLARRLKRRPLRKVRYIAIDEFSVQKGHRYMTLVVDLESGEVLYAHEGKDAASVIPFLERLKQAGAPLRAVAIDMSEAFANAVRSVYGSKVDIVHDPFHVVALASEAIDETRRDLVRSLDGPERKVIKGTRFLLLKGLENLKPSSLERLMLLMEANEPLYQAYLLKEDLRQFWSLPDAAAGSAFLDNWTAEARATGIVHFARLAKTLDAHRPGLLAYFRHRISTGPLEGLNNKVKVLKRQAYGFRDMEYFKLRLYFLHETPLSLTG
jgi:transposase